MNPYRATIVRGGPRPVIRIDRRRDLPPIPAADTCVADLEEGDRVLVLAGLDGRPDQWVVIGRLGAAGEQLPLVPLR